MTTVLPLLLPLRIEIRYTLVRGGWDLRMLIVPDTVWFDEHRPRPTKRELESLRAWQGRTARGAGGADETAAWEQFATEVGAARAVWLARTFGPRRIPTSSSRPTS